MLNFLVKCCLGLAICTAFSGCSDPAGGDAGMTDEQLNQSDSKEALKKQLLEIAESGQAGSAVMGIRESLEQLKQTDTSIGDEIMTLCGELESEGNPANAKSIAKKMADLL